VHCDAPTLGTCAGSWQEQMHGCALTIALFYFSFFFFFYVCAGVRTGCRHTRPAPAHDRR